MGFSRPFCPWRGLPCPLPEHFPDPGIEPGSPTLQEDSLLLSHLGSTVLQSPIQVISHYFFSAYFFCSYLTLFHIFRRYYFLKWNIAWNGVGNCMCLFSYRDLVYSGRRGKKGIFSACLRIKFLYNLCGLSFKKERRRKGRRKGRRKDLTENLFPNSSLILVTFGDKWQMLNLPIPSPNDRFVFLWSIYAGKRFISDVN